MTAPSTSKQLEDAKAALKQKFIDMLVKKDYKTAKIEKLLADSEQFRNLLSASAADVMQQAKAQGYGDNANTRFSATKIAESEAQKVIEQLRVAVPAELKTRIEQDYLAIEGAVVAARGAYGRCDNALVVIEEVSGWEFMTNLASADIVKIKWNKTKISSLAEKMRERETSLETTRGKLDAVVSSENERELRDAIRVVESDLTTLREKVRTTQAEADSVLRGLGVEIKDRALEAFMAKLVKEDIEKFEKVVDGLDKLRGFAMSIFKATEATNTINRGLELTATVAKAAGRAEIIDRAAKKHMQSHTDDEVRAEHSKDPLMLAREMFHKQETAMTIVLQGLGTTLSGALIAAHGAGEVVMKVWDPVVKVIEEVFKSRVKARLKLAEDAIKARDVAAAKAAQTDEGKTEEGMVESLLRRGLLTVGKEVAKEYGKDAVHSVTGLGEASDGPLSFLTKIADEPEKFVDKILEVVLKPVMKKIWEIFPPKPAEEVTGEDLRNMANMIVIAQVPVGMGLMDRGDLAPKSRQYTEMEDRPEDISEEIWNKF
jgi:hypothetical protein